MPPARATVQEVRSIRPLKESLTPLNPVFFAVKGFGVIGGGAVLFAASGLAGSAILPLLGIVLPFLISSGSILKNMLSSILRSVWLGRSGCLERGRRDKELLHSSILQVRQVRLLELLGLYVGILTND